MVDLNRPTNHPTDRWIAYTGNMNLVVLLTFMKPKLMGYTVCTWVTMFINKFWQSSTWPIIWIFFITWISTWSSKTSDCLGEVWLSVYNNGALYIAKHWTVQRYRNYQQNFTPSTWLEQSPRNTFFQSVEMFFST